MITTKKKGRGAALILVLMVVGILGLLSLQMGLNVKANLNRAERLQQRTEALLRLQSNEAAIVFTLLTEPWVTTDSKADSANPYTTAWNFRGEPFEIDGVRYSIQDEKGLLPLPQAGDPTEGLERVLQSIGVDRQRARAFVEAVQSEQDPGFRSDLPNARPVPWQSVDELQGLGGILTDSEFHRLRSLLTLYPTADFNPATAPQSVLASRYDKGTVDTLTALQQSNGLDMNTFYQTIDSSFDEFITFYPGPTLRVSAEAIDRQFHLRRERSLKLRPYEAEPVLFWSRRQ